LFEALYHFNENIHPEPAKFAHASILEIVWTIIPALILLYIAGPSFTLLYALDECSSRILVVRIIGHQWYWTYEIPTDNAANYLSFDSYLVNTNDLIRGRFRLLEVDNRLFLPVNTHISLVITSADVIHSWTVPSFGIKLDACPGRLAHVTLYFQREGIFYGQCSEICGTGHGFMPIVVRVVSDDKWQYWRSEYIQQV
jgi:cytochrome c oxidase subunit 2